MVHQTRRHREGFSSDPFAFDLQAIRVTKGTEDPQREDLKESQERPVYQVRTLYLSGVPGRTAAVVNSGFFLQANLVELHMAKTAATASGDPAAWTARSACPGPPAPPA